MNPATISSFDDNSEEELTSPDGYNAQAVVDPTSMVGVSMILSLIHQLCLVSEKDTQQGERRYQLLRRYMSENKFLPPESDIEALVPMEVRFTQAFQQIMQTQLPNPEGEPRMLSLPATDREREAILSRFQQPTITPETVFEMYLTQNQRYRTEFEEICTLGKGGFGKVYKVRGKLDQNLFAIKKILLKRQGKYKNSRKIMKEVRLLSHLQHPNIVGYNTSWIAMEGNNVSHLHSSAKLRSKVVTTLRCLPSSSSESPRSSSEQDSSNRDKNKVRIKDLSSESRRCSPKLNNQLTLLTESPSRVQRSPSDSLSTVVGSPTTPRGCGDFVVVSPEITSKDPSDDCPAVELALPNDLVFQKFTEFQSSSLSASGAFTPDSTSNLADREECSDSLIQFKDDSIDLEKSEASVTSEVWTACAVESTTSITGDHVLEQSKKHEVYGTTIGQTLGTPEFRRSRSYSSQSCRITELDENHIGQTRTKIRHRSKSEDRLEKVRTNSSTREISVVPAGFPYSVVLYIQMQLCTKTLNDWLGEQNKRAELRTDSFDVVDVGCNTGILKQILDGIMYIHDQGIIHRDLKPKNIFLNSSGDQHHVLIGDFGLAKEEIKDCFETGQTNDGTSLGAHIGRANERLHTEAVGTKTYASPEQIEGRDYDCKSDMYSIGIILLEMFHPFTTQMERGKVIGEVRQGNIPEEIFRRWPHEHQTITELTNRESGRRPRAKDILKGPIFATEHQTIEKLQAALSAKDAELSAKDAELSAKDAKLSAKEAEIQILRQRMAELMGRVP